MANREVNLTKMVQTLHGWRYCRVVLPANGRVKPDLPTRRFLSRLAPMPSPTLRQAKKRPISRVPKWPADIPVAGCCTLCPETIFRAASSHHRPQKAGYIENFSRNPPRRPRTVSPASASLETNGTKWRTGLVPSHAAAKSVFLG
jgi:hypothetical protein